MIIWCLGTSSPFDTDAHSEHGRIIMCSVGSIVAFCCAVGYLNTLAFVNFAVVFFLRNRSNTLNEGKFLRFSVCWCSAVSG